MSSRKRDRDDGVGGSNNNTKKKASIVVSGEDAPNLIFEAAYEGNVETVQACLDTGVIELAAVNDAGFTVLHQAAMGANNVEHLGGTVNVIRLLLQHNPPLEAKADNEGQATPLQVAVDMASTVQPVQILLDAGCDPQCKDKWGRNLLANAPCCDGVATLLTEKYGIQPPPPPPPPRKPAKMTAKEWKTSEKQIQAAFDELESKHNVVCLGNAGVTQQDGMADCAEKMSTDASVVVGCCFYTRQDQNQAKKTGEMHLGFAVKDSDEESAAAKKVELGRVIVRAFQEAGLEIEWQDENPANRPRLNLKDTEQ